MEERGWRGFKERGWRREDEARGCDESMFGAERRMVENTQENTHEKRTVRCTGRYDGQRSVDLGKRVGFVVRKRGWLLKAGLAKGPVEDIAEEDH
eukprot:138208-Rhodomonas_salina.1